MDLLISDVSKKIFEHGMCICIYIYIYTYVCMYIYIYMWDRFQNQDPERCALMPCNDFGGPESWNVFDFTNICKYIDIHRSIHLLNYVCICRYVPVCLYGHRTGWYRNSIEIYVIYVYKCSRLILKGRPFCETFFK